MGAWQSSMGTSVPPKRWVSARLRHNREYVRCLGRRPERPHRRVLVPVSHVASHLGRLLFPAVAATGPGPGAAFTDLTAWRGTCSRRRNPAATETRWVTGRRYHAGRAAPRRMVPFRSRGTSGSLASFPAIGMFRSRWFSRSIARFSCAGAKPF